MAANEETIFEKQEHTALKQLERSISNNNDLRLSLDLKLLWTGSDFNINRQLESGNTLLHIAASKANSECVRILLEKGADPEIKNENEDQPIDLARQREYSDPYVFDIVALIESHQEAIKLRRKEIILELVQTAIQEQDGASLENIFSRNLGDVKSYINSPLAEGNTLLHIAAINGKKDCVRILLENGADPKRKNDGNFKPIDLARDRGYEDVVKQIENHKTSRLLQQVGFFESYEKLQKKVEELEKKIKELEEPKERLEVGYQPFHEPHP